MDFTQRKNGKRVFFSEASFKTIGEILSELLSKSRARVLLFADMNGYPITHLGDLADIELSTLTALAAGDFSATSEMARLVGEPDTFAFIYHEGQQHNIYLSKVSENYLLVVIFDVGIALGMIRVYTNRAVEKLIALIDSLAVPDTDTTEMIDLEFKTLLGQELDKSF